MKEQFEVIKGARELLSKVSNAHQKRCNSERLHGQDPATESPVRQWRDRFNHHFRSA